MKTAVIAITMSALFIVGCASGTQYFKSNGLPRDHFYIGGGYAIDYTAQTTGTLYIVEKSSNKLVVTKSMSSGERFENSIDLADESVMELSVKLAIKPEKMEFAFYFIPM